MGVWDMYKIMGGGGRFAEEVVDSRARGEYLKPSWRNR